MKSLQLIILSLFIITSVVAKPKFLGNVLTTGIIKSNLTQYKITDGKLISNDASALFASGKIMFVSAGIKYELETDESGRVYIECLFFFPKTSSENNALVNLYKLEGQITEDRISYSHRNVAIYLVKTQDRIISSDISSSWTSNDLGRIWDINTRVTYVLSTR